jgi:UDP-N-acetylglucosamine 4-epimerase
VAGFIGSHLLETLLSLNQHVVGLDNFSTGSPANLEQVRETVGRECWSNFRQVEGDIRALDTCMSACRGVDFVLHQAALGSVPRSIEHPLDAHASNVTGFLNMLLGVRDNRVRRIVYASSSAVYGNHPSLPKMELEIGQCLSPYAATKRANELYAGVFAQCYGLETIGLRYFNVFGARQNPNGPYAAVIPKWIEAFIQRRPIYLNGDGETSRDFSYVANVVQANLLAATVQEAEASNQIYNIALHSRTTLNQLFKLLHGKLLPFYPRLAGCQPVYREFRQGDVKHSEASIAKAEKFLGYRPTHNLEQGLAEALDWYRQHLS